jgi:hypothetical protein
MVKKNAMVTRSSLYDQLKKEGRRNEYEMHKLLALNQRQKMVIFNSTQFLSTCFV